MRVGQDDPFSFPKGATTVLVWESQSSAVSVNLVRSLHLSEPHLNNGNDTSL